jgi:hypothetical protein
MQNQAVLRSVFLIRRASRESNAPSDTALSDLYYATAIAQQMQERLLSPDIHSNRS